MTEPFSQMPREFLVLVWIKGKLHPSVSLFWKTRKCYWVLRKKIWYMFLPEIKKMKLLHLISRNDQVWKVDWHRWQSKFGIWFGTRLERWYLLSFSRLQLFHREWGIWEKKFICDRGGKLILDLAEVTIGILCGA